MKARTSSGRLPCFLAKSSQSDRHAAFRISSVAGWNSAIIRQAAWGFSQVITGMRSTGRPRTVARTRSRDVIRSLEDAGMCVSTFSGNPDARSQKAPWRRSGQLSSPGASSTSPAIFSYSAPIIPSPGPADIPPSMAMA